MQNIKSYCLSACLVLGMQSLADVAREEAKRRLQLEERGIEGKVIEANTLPSLSEKDRAAPMDSSKKEKSVPDERASSQERVSLRSYRTKLKKLDRSIQQNEERLELIRTRLLTAQRTLNTPGKLSAVEKAIKEQERLQKEIEELQLKLKQLRRERREIYEEGRKDGYLPGELEGRG